MRSLRLVLSFCLPLALSACVSATDTSDDAQTERGPLGKADAAGSCLSDDGDFCGGPTDGACWCDDLCENYGDCCSDYEPVCLGDGGCLSNADCGAGEFCSFESGCGEGPVGECATMPQACIQLFAPVCGCDGQTYGNSCVAAGNGVSVQSQGPCVPDTPPDPPPGQSCEDNCGGKAGNCWCDDLCSDYGDCCDDYEDWCEEEPPPPPPPPPPPLPETCDELEEQFTAETEAIRSCSTDAECGQVLSGTSCGCTRNWVARSDADTSHWETLRELAPGIENGCNLPGTISTCDCPAVDGFACVQGTCSWNYL